MKAGTGAGIDEETPPLRLPMNNHTRNTRIMKVEEKTLGVVLGLGGVGIGLFLFALSLFF